MIWRCKRCHGTTWADGKCAHCQLPSEGPTAAEDETFVAVFIECEACAHREQVEDEEVARQAVAEHLRGCRKAHKGLGR